MKNRSQNLPFKFNLQRYTMGALLVPSSRESGRGVPRSWKLVVEESGDGGRTWTKQFLRFDGNAIQPALWIGADGRPRMLARSASDYDIKTGKRADPVRLELECRVCLWFVCVCAHQQKPT